MALPLAWRAKKTLKQSLYWNFALWQKLGLNILPNHFYSGIPDLRDLKARTDWRHPRTLHGVRGAGLDDQAAYAQSLFTTGRGGPPAERDIHAEAVRANGEGGGYGEVEADFLYAFVRHARPGKIVQVGCGVSTAVIQMAAADAGLRPRIVCIDPYPTPFLTRQAEAGKIELIARPAQEVGIDLLLDMSPGDMFFVDSTHTVKVGSEVNRIILEVLPRLGPGIFVHFHDIYFPFDHGRGVLSGDLFFPMESVLLHAYLAGNPSIEILACLSMLHYGAPEVLRELIARYDPEGNDGGLATGTGTHFPSSIFLRTIGNAGEVRPGEVASGDQP